MSEVDLAAEFPESRRLGLILGGRRLTIAVAESCTGGLLGAVLTAVPGSSVYVRGGVIAYANDVKTSLLGVEGDLIAGEGAVSEVVAKAMAVGARERLRADVGVGITGVAGPAADENGKPAGLIYVAVAQGDRPPQVTQLSGDDGREANRSRAVRRALTMCIDVLRLPQP